MFSLHDKQLLSYSMRFNIKLCILCVCILSIAPQPLPYGFWCRILHTQFCNFYIIRNSRNPLLVFLCTQPHILFTITLAIKNNVLWHEIFGVYKLLLQRGQSLFEDGCIVRVSRMNLLHQRHVTIARNKQFLNNLFAICSVVLRKAMHNFYATRLVVPNRVSNSRWLATFILPIKTMRCCIAMESFYL